MRLNARAQKLGLYKGQPLANARAMVQRACRRAGR